MSPTPPRTYVTEVTRTYPEPLFRSSLLFIEFGRVAAEPADGADMETKLKIVTRLPLGGLWRDSGPVNAVRGRELSSADVRALLRMGPVQFVVVDVGVKPRWIDPKDCYGFWMDEVQSHFAEPTSENAALQVSNVYCYWASEWQSDESEAPIVVLELRH